MPAQTIINPIANSRALSISPSNRRLEYERYHAPLNAFHVVPITFEFLLEHCFFTDAAHCDREDQDQAHDQAPHGAEQQWTSNEQEQGAGVHRVSDDAVHSV